MRRILQFTLLALFGATALARADVVLLWNEAALDLIRNRGVPPPAASRHLAILHCAIHDAVNGIRGKHHQYMTTGKAFQGASREAAAAAAARDVLIYLYPMDQPFVDTLYQTILATIRNGPPKIHGVAWGKHAAKTILDDRADDGWNQAVTFVPGTAPGEWRPTISFGGLVRPALLPHWGAVRPFALERPDQFRPPSPPPMDSQQYADELNFVKEWGGLVSAMRDADQTQVAVFWGYGPRTATPPGHWNQIAAVTAQLMKNTLEENARLFALVNIAMADAAIVSWDCKFVYNLWRPIAAIHEADTDGNPATEPDLTWAPLLETPPFPEYTSGHSTFSAAAAIALAGFYGTDSIPFSVGSDDLPGVIRHYDSFSHAAEESGISRIYGGIHFMSANIHGLDTGAAIGELVLENYLVSKHPKKPKKPAPKPPAPPKPAKEKSKKAPKPGKK